jgi:DNA-directed RNA polymerase subunit RPC12/RpoP
MKVRDPLVMPIRTISLDELTKKISCITEPLDKLLEEYTYWKKHGKFPEEMAQPPPPPQYPPTRDCFGNKFYTCMKCGGSLIKDDNTLVYVCLSCGGKTLCENR